MSRGCSASTGSHPGRPHQHLRRDPPLSQRPARVGRLLEPRGAAEVHGRRLLARRPRDQHGVPLPPLLRLPGDPVAGAGRARVLADPRRVVDQEGVQARQGAVPGRGDDTHGGHHRGDQHLLRPGRLRRPPEPRRGPPGPDPGPLPREHLPRAGPGAARRRRVPHRDRHHLRARLPRGHAPPRGAGGGRIHAPLPGQPVLALHAGLDIPPRGRATRTSWWR